MRSAWIVLIFLATAFLASAREEAVAPPDLLDFVTTAHRASRELIQTSHCRVKFEIMARVGNPERAVTQSCRSESWHSSTAIRVKAVEGDQALEYLWADSVSKAIVTRNVNGMKEVAATRNAFSNRYSHRGDAWLRGLLVVNRPGTGKYMPFEELVQEASKTIRVEKQAVDGMEMIIVKLVPRPD